MHAVCRSAVLPWCDLMPTTCLTAGQTAKCHSQDVVGTAEAVTAESQQHTAVQKATGGQPSNRQRERDCAEHDEVPGSAPRLLLRPEAAARRAVEQDAALRSAAVCLGEAPAIVQHSQQTGSGSGSDGGTLAVQAGLCRDAAGSSAAVAAWLQDASCGVEMRHSLGRQVCCSCLRTALCWRCCCWLAGARQV